MPKPGYLAGDKRRQAGLNIESGSYTSLPDTDTEIVHNLGHTPTTVFLEPLSTGVEGYALESARSATSITIRANVSGVDVNWETLA